MNDVQRQEKELLKIFERRRPDGRYYYNDKDVRHFLPVMALSSNVDLSKHPSLKKVMDELLAKLGLTDNINTAIVGKAIKDYYAKNPVNPELLAEYRAFCRQQKAA